VVLVAALATVAFGGSAAPAQAAPSSCSFNYEQPFYGWSDQEWYGLAPGANFPTSRTPSGWSLSKAVVVSGGNPHRPWSSDYSLSLPAGASATTPAFCVDQASPYSRMFAYTTTPNPAVADGLKVEIIYTDAVTRKTVTKQVATLNQQSGWNPTGAFPLVGGSVSPKWDSSGRSTVKYKFTAINSTAWRIDDLFIDPKRH
jgi:hypothetical protein